MIVNKPHCMCPCGCMRLVKEWYGMNTTCLRCDYGDHVKPKEPETNLKQGKLGL